MDNKRKIPVFFDMDGTLAKWETQAHFDEVVSPGYFRNREPIKNMVDAVALLSASEDLEVFICSKVIAGTTAVEDKNYWLDHVMPALPMKNRFFVPYENPDKNDIPIEGGILPYYVLVDDSTHYGLAGWKGTGIKVLNGINNTCRSWKGYVVSSQSLPEVIARTILSICKTEKMFFEEKRI